MRNWRKPVVDELARLLAMVSRFICCALIPLAAVYKARIIANLLEGFWTIPCSLFPVPCRSHLGQILGGDLVELGMEDGERFLHHLRLALNQNQVQRPLNHVLVGALDSALVNCGIG